MEMERCVAGREKNVQSQRDMKDYIWEVVNYCVWLECGVRASHALLLKDRRRSWGERQGQSMMESCRILPLLWVKKRL